MLAVTLFCSTGFSLCFFDSQESKTLYFQLLGGFVYVIQHMAIPPHNDDGTLPLGAATAG